jgi:hypothetical protein
MLHFITLTTDPFWCRYSRHARAIQTLSNKAMCELGRLVTRLVILCHEELQVVYNSETAERRWSIDVHGYCTSHVDCVMRRMENR